MYKHEDLSPMDAVFGAADLGDLVTQLTMVRTIARCDRDVVRTIETTKRELSDRAATLVADERTAEKLVGTCKSELSTIRASLDERRAALAGVRWTSAASRQPRQTLLQSLRPPSSRPSREAAVASPAPVPGGRSSRARPRATASTPVACTG